MKLMLFRFSAMGDVAMTVPVIKTLLDTYPELEIIMVSRPFFAPLFKDLPRLKFIGVDLKTSYKGLPGLYRLFRELKQYQPRAIADLHDVLRTKILRFFFKTAGYKVAVINKGRQEKKALTRSQNKILKPLPTTHERYADVFRKLGWALDLKNYKPQYPELSVQVALFLENFKDKKIIGIAPFAAHPGKEYPLKKTKELIRLILQKNEKVDILLFGGGNIEKQKLDELEKINRNRIVNLAGVFSFEEELQIISRLALMLSMDSGNGHLAAIFGVPVITIWGLTHPFAGFTPFNQPDEYQIIPDLKTFPQLPTSVYGNKTFEGFEQIWETISPEIIVDKIMNVLVQKD